MRDLSFPLISLGSSAMENIPAEDVAAWIHEIKGNVVDITTFQLDYLYSIQKDFVTEPAAGGDFYGKRIAETMGAVNSRVVDDISLDMKGIESDIHYIPKKSVFSLPSFSQLHLKNDSYSNVDDFQEDGIKTFRRICRELRDNGVERIIIHSESPIPEEFEAICGKYYLWWCPSEFREDLLEISHSLILPADEVMELESLIDSYDVRQIYLLNATKESLSSALELFDKEAITISGYAPGKNQKEYWEQLSKTKILSNISKNSSY